MDGWSVGWMGGWADGRMGGWLDGWMDSHCVSGALLLVHDSLPIQLDLLREAGLRRLTVTAIVAVGNSFKCKHFPPVSLELLIWNQSFRLHNYKSKS